MDLLAILEVFIRTMWTYPMLPFISTGLLWFALIAVLPFWGIAMIIAMIVGRIERGEPVPWKSPRQPVDALPYDPVKAEQNREWLRRYYERKEREKRWKTQTKMSR
jgi:hypothetical protein